MMGKNQNPNVLLNRAQRKENINKGKRSIVQVPTEGGKNVCTRDMRIPYMRIPYMRHI